MSPVNNLKCMICALFSEGKWNFADPTFLSIRIRVRMRHLDFSAQSADERESQRPHIPAPPVAILTPITTPLVLRRRCS